MLSMRKKLLFIALALGVFVVARLSQQEAPGASTTSRVSSRTAWQPSQEVLHQVRQTCQVFAFPELGECFVKQMQSAGASPEAIAFSRGLYNEGYLQKFQETGRVDIAWVMYPFRANENSGCLLVNGMPPQVDVDNLSQLPRDQLNADGAWKALLAKYPHATLWPGDRTGASGVRAESQSTGGQRFIVDYRVLDGCHACARLGVVHYAFDFDAKGEFRSALYLDVQERGRDDHVPLH
jgi:hypothetical protein